MLLPPPVRRVRPSALLLPVVLLLLRADAAGAVSGVCPDGSIFIVQRADAIPCRDAKRVEPGDIPPLNPEFLPRPYGWEVFNRETDPNNPYNLVDQAGPPGAAPAPSGDPVAAGASAFAPGPSPSPGGPGTAPLPPAPAVAVASAPPSPPPGLDLALTRQDLDDLAAIIAVRQQRAPATLVRRSDDGEGELALRLARSEAFEARVGQALARRNATPGRVLAFQVEATQGAEFWGNLTFVQGHVAFHPDASDAAQFGVLDGRLGPLQRGERVLGYAVLPAHVDLAQPLEIYWDDQRFRATLTP